MMTLPERLKKAMELSGMTQAELARASHLDEATVSRILSGEQKKPAAFTVAKMAWALGVSQDWLNPGAVEKDTEEADG